MTTGYKQTEVGVIPEDWTMKPLKELTHQIIDGTHHTPRYTDSGIPFLRVTDIQLPDINLSNLKFISKQDHEILKRRCNPEKGDLLLSKNGTIGIPKIIFWDWEFSIFVSLALIKLKSTVIPLFIEQFFKSNFLDNQIRQRSKQGAVTNLHLEEIREFLIPFPPTLAEQQAIAEALSDADTLIESLEQLIAKKRLIKQGAMQELLTGKKRLPGFGGEWEMCGLGSVADPNQRWSFTGGPFGSNLKSSDYEKVGVRIIQLQNIGDGEFKDDYEIYTSRQKADELLSCNIYPGEIILSKMGDPVARACIIPPFQERYVMCSDGIRLAIDKKHFNTYFVYTQINAPEFRGQAANAGTGSTRKRIGLNELKGLELRCPPLPEQTAIAAILSDMDTEIAAMEAKLAKARQIKQGMMRELLTGKIRIINRKLKVENGE